MHFTQGSAYNASTMFSLVLYSIAATWAASVFFLLWLEIKKDGQFMVVFNAIHNWLYSLLHSPRAALTSLWVEFWNSWVAVGTVAGLLYTAALVPDLFGFATAKWFFVLGNILFFIRLSIEERLHGKKGQRKQIGERTLIMLILLGLFSMLSFLEIGSVANREAGKSPNPYNIWESAKFWKQQQRPIPPQTSTTPPLPPPQASKPTAPEQQEPVKPANPVMSHQRPPAINPTFRAEFSATTFEQFPEETMIGGLSFNHREIAVHFYAFVDRSDVEDLNTHIWLVHRGGRITGISGIGPISTCPGIVISQPTSADVTPKTVTVVGGKSPVTVPLNSTSSVGSLSTSPSGSWLIHCDKILKGMTPDFIIRVLRPISNKNQPDPLRWRLLDALVAQGTYKTKSGKEVNFRNISIYDDDGNPHSADKSESEEILKRGSAGATTYYLPTRPPSQ